MFPGFSKKKKAALTAYDPPSNALPSAAASAPVSRWQVLKTFPMGNSRKSC